jgi:hypothetical protein
MREARAAAVEIMEEATVAELCEKSRRLSQPASPAPDYVI